MVENEAGAVVVFQFLDIAQCVAAVVRDANPFVHGRLSAGSGAPAH